MEHHVDREGYHHFEFESGEIGECVLNTLAESGIDEIVDFEEKVDENGFEFWTVKGR
jgi:hypothetical protein